MATAAGYRMPIFEPDPVFVPPFPCLPCMRSCTPLCCPVHLPDVLRTPFPTRVHASFRRLVLQTSMRASYLLFWRAACFA